MSWLSTHHSRARESGRERVFSDDEAGRLRSDARDTRDAPEGALFSIARPDAPMPAPVPRLHPAGARHTYA
jgi:hypothetical protein